MFSLTLFLTFWLLAVRAMDFDPDSRVVSVIPLRFTEDSVPWVGVDRETHKCLQLPDDPDIILAGLMDYMAGDDFGTQYGIDDEHVLVCLKKLLVLPEAGLVRFPEGNLLWIQVFAPENEDISQDFRRFRQMIPKHQIDKHYFESTPLRQRDTRAAILYSRFPDGSIYYFTSNEYPKTPLTNFGVTCFMNSVLQMLFHIRPFMSSLLQIARAIPHEELITKKIAAIFAYMLGGQRTPDALLDDLYLNMQIYFSDNIVEGQQHDANEFMGQLLRLLITENSHEQFWNHASFIETLFSIDREQHALCNDPAHQRILPKRQPDLLLELSFEHTHQNEPSLDFQESIQRALAPQYLEDVARHEGCGIHTVTKIKDFPPILMFKINRLAWNTETKNRVRIDGALNFPFKGLDLGQYVDPKNGLQGERYVYDLIGTINQTGGLNGGHYTASTFHEYYENGQPKIAAHFISDAHLFDNISVKQHLQFSRSHATTLIYARRSQNDPRPVAFDEAALEDGPEADVFDFMTMTFRSQLTMDFWDFEGANKAMIEAANKTVEAANKTTTFDHQPIDFFDFDLEAANKARISQLAMLADCDTEEANTIPKPSHIQNAMATTNSIDLTSIISKFSTGPNAANTSGATPMANDDDTDDHVASDIALHDYNDDGDDYFGRLNDASDGFGDENDRHIYIDLTN